jgi:hypothetical protein
MNGLIMAGTSSDQKNYEVEIALLKHLFEMVETNMKEIDNDVKALRSELNAGIKQLSAQIAQINITLAKWGVGISVALFVAKLAADHLLK